MVTKQIGEVVIRTPNMQKMVAFYRDVVGLELFKVLGTMHFFQVAEGLGGQTQAFGLFDLDIVSDVDDTRKTPVHHFAFIIDFKDHDNELNRIAGLGCEIRKMVHAVTQSRSFYFYDPDGNTVEFVCHDSSIPLSD